ncbi:MAG: hypothetical protein ACRDRR_14455 [Pseudonocardiaceae bacterium]
MDVLQKHIVRARASGGVFALVRGGPDHHIAHEPSVLSQEPDEFRVRHATDERSGARQT